MFPFRRTDKVVHEIEERGKLYFLLNSLLGAYNRRTDMWKQGGGENNSELLTAINNLSRKVEEFMSTQETRLQGIQTALTSIAEGINTLQEQVATLKVNNPDMEDEIAGIESTVKSIADDINGVVPGGTGGGTTEPTPEG